MFSNAQLNQTVFHFESFEDPKKTLFGAKAESQSNYKTKMKLQTNKEQMVNTHLTRFWNRWVEEKPEANEWQTHMSSKQKEKSRWKMERKKGGK